MHISRLRKPFSKIFGLQTNFQENYQVSNFGKFLIEILATIGFGLGIVFFYFELRKISAYFGLENISM